MRRDVRGLANEAFISNPIVSGLKTLVKNLQTDIVSSPQQNHEME